MRLPFLCFAASTLLVPALSRAQSTRLEVVWPTGEHNPTRAIVPLDADDDDDDGVPDALAEPAPDPARDDEVVNVTVNGVGAGAVRVHTTGGVRIATRTGLVDDATLPAGPNGRAIVPLVGITTSRATDDASVTFTAAESTARVAVTVVSALMLHGDNRVAWGHHDALRLSERVTNDETLPRARMDRHLERPRELPRRSLGPGRHGLSGASNRWAPAHRSASRPAWCATRWQTRSSSVRAKIFRCDRGSCVSSATTSISARPACKGRRCSSACAIACACAIDAPARQVKPPRICASDVRATRTVRSRRERRDGTSS